MNRSLRPRATLAAVVLSASPLLAGGVVELETMTPVATIDREELERIPISRNFQDLANLVPNVVGVTRFSGDAGDYNVRLRGLDQQVPIRIGEDEITSLRIGQDGSVTPRPDPFPTSFQPQNASAVRGHSIAFRTENQLITIELATPYGTVYVSAPEVAPAGAATTWTATAIPSGATDRERRRNQAQLDNMQVMIGTPAVELRPGEQVVIPARREQGVALREGGTILASGTIPFLHSSAWNGGIGGVDASGSAGLPPVFAGGALTIPGRFDGMTGNTRVTVGGRPVRIVAESPYGVSIYTPTDQIGACNIVVEEGGQRGSGVFFNLGLEITADKYDLVRGESTTCHVYVHGLAGYGETVNLVLINRTPGVVSMAPGNNQVLRIVPGSHDARGTLQVDRQFTGIQRGRFRLQAILLPPGARLPGSGR